MWCLLVDGFGQEFGVRQFACWPTDETVLAGDGWLMFVDEEVGIQVPLSSDSHEYLA